MIADMLSTGNYGGQLYGFILRPSEYMPLSAWLEPSLEYERKIENMQKRKLHGCGHFPPKPPISYCAWKQFGTTGIMQMRFFYTL